MEKKITICGVTYPSVAEAARKLDINEHTLRKRIYRGWDDCLLAVPAYKKEITICGVTYPSIAEAARQLNITRSALRGRISRGLKDSQLAAPLKAKEKPVTINGIAYASVTQAAKALGVATSTLARKLASGLIDEELLASVAQRKLNPNRMKKRPVTIDGIDYPSIKTASKATGLNYQTLVSRIKRGEMEGTRPKIKTITIEGTTFPTLKSACETYGVTVSSVYQRVKRLGESCADALLYLSTHPGKKRTKKEVTIEGTTFPTLKSACETYGVTVSRVNRRVKRLGESYADAILFLHSLDQVEKYEF